MLRFEFETICLGVENAVGVYEPSNRQRFLQSRSNLEPFAQVPNQFCVAGVRYFNSKDAAIRGFKINETLRVKYIRKFNFPNIACD